MFGPPYGGAARVPLTGTRARSLHAYLASGRHALLVGGSSERASQAAARLREAVPDDVDVLLLTGAQGPARDGGGHDTAHPAGPVRGEWVGHVPPDAVVAAVADLPDPAWRAQDFVGAASLSGSQRSRT